jgi:signal transduction histidine kinase
MGSRTKHARRSSRGTGTGWLVLFILAVVLLFNLSSWYLYHLARRRLDTELGLRLRSIASVLSVSLAREPALQVDDPRLRSALMEGLHPALERVRDENALSNVFVTGPGDTTWIDLSGGVPPGEPNPFLDVDFSAVSLARSGVPSYSRLYTIEGQYMKSAYAPIVDAGGRVTGLVGVEAGAGFFGSLRNLRSILLAVTLGSGLGIVALGGIFFAANRSLASARLALERSETLTAMGRMTAGLAHEIRNPLAIIRGAAERLRAGKRDEVETERLLGFVAEEVDRLDGILNGYLAFARGEPPIVETFDLLEILRRSVSTLEGELESAAVRIETDFSAPKRTIRGDPRHVQQVFLNLILNARDAMPGGGTLRILERPEGRGFRLEFHDQGVGIQRADLDSVFEPFFTRKERGSGLGLAVVRRVVEEHGGRVRVTSRPGEGTCFTLHFDRAYGSGD